MGFLDKVTQLQKSAMEGAMSLQKASMAGAAALQKAQLSAMQSRMGGGPAQIELLNDEQAAVRFVLQGAEMPDQIRATRVARLEHIRASERPDLAWCPNCTRVYRGLKAPNQGLMAGIADAMASIGASNEHKCTEFCFPPHAGHCLECAIARGAQIPCALTGQMITPRPDPSVDGFGHSIVRDDLHELLKDGGVIEPDRSVRPMTPQERSAVKGINRVRRMFKECPVDVKPRTAFVELTNPHWVLGHFARICAEAVGLETAEGGYAADGTYYCQVDHNYFTLKPSRDRFEIDMCVDKEHFSIETANAAGSAFKGAVSGGLGVGVFTGNSRSIASGAAFGAVGGLMAAAEEKKQADAARDMAITVHCAETTKLMIDLAKSPLANTRPPMLAEAGTAPKRTEIRSWPDGIDVGRAASILQKHPL